MKSKPRCRPRSARCDARSESICHNDSEVAVANTIAGGAQRRDAGAGHDQRLRRALRQREPGFDHRQSSAQARLPMRAARRSSRRCARSRCWSTSSPTSRRITRQAYVGRSAFAHKAGLHVSGIQRNVHDLRAYRSGAGRQRSPRAAFGAFRPRQHPVQEQGVRPRHRSEQRENRRRCSTSSSGSRALGYTFDGADASFELLMLRTLGLAQRPFQLRQLPRVRRQVA